jgi:G-patch domain
VVLDTRFVQGRTLLPTDFGRASGEATHAGSSVRTRLQSQLSGLSRHPDLSRGAIGHKLLVRSGWKPGSGLGKHETGMTEAVAAFAKAGRHGIGAESAQTLHQVGIEQPVERPGKRMKAETEGRVQNARQKEQSEADAALAEPPASAAAQARRDAAIQRAMFRDFADNSETGGAHVLLRPKKDRISSNPLRHMFS